MTGSGSDHQNKVPLYNYQMPLTRLSPACGRSRPAPLARCPVLRLLVLSQGCTTVASSSDFINTLPILNPTAIVELASTAKSFKTTVNSVGLLCPFFDTIILSSPPAESVARTSRAVLTELLTQTAWLSSADVHSSQLTFQTVTPSGRTYSFLLRGKNVFTGKIKCSKPVHISVLSVTKLSFKNSFLLHRKQELLPP